MNQSAKEGPLKKRVVLQQIAIEEAWKHREALTFDDVDIEPSYSDVPPWKTSLETTLVKGIELGVPLVSSPMDDVTEARTAIALALNHGIGVLHYNCTSQKQAGMVRQVKSYRSKFVTNPICVQPRDTIEKVVALQRKTENQHFTVFPVVWAGRDGKLAGISSKRDRKFSLNPDVDYIENFMTPRKSLRVAYSGITADEAYEIMLRERLSSLPIVTSRTDDQLVGVYFFKDLAKTRKRKSPFTEDDEGRLRVAAAVNLGGTDDRDARLMERATLLGEAGVDVFVIDTANGHVAAMRQTIERLKKYWPDIPVIAGNIATKRAAEALVSWGADALRVGIGGGSICTTGIVTGVRTPQVTAIWLARKGSRGRVPIIADGGLRNSGDLAKAIAAGADVCMIGNLFAGTRESPGGEPFVVDGQLRKRYRGMGSEGAMADGGASRYGSEHAYRPVPQGIEGTVPYRGEISGVIEMLTGGLGSAMSSVGCASIADMHQNAEFIRHTASGLREAHVHDVSITKEAPNYHP